MLIRNASNKMRIFEYSNVFLKCHERVKVFLHYVFWDLCVSENLMEILKEKMMSRHPIEKIWLLFFSEKSTVLRERLISESLTFIRICEGADNFWTFTYVLKVLYWIRANPSIPRLDSAWWRKILCPLLCVPERVSLSSNK